MVYRDKADKRARKQMRAKMRKGAKAAQETGITDTWLAKYGDTYRKFFHTRNSSVAIPDPAIAREYTRRHLYVWLVDELNGGEWRPGR